MSTRSGRSLHQLELERISFNYEAEVLDQIDEGLTEIEDIMEDLESEGYLWEHVEGGEEPLAKAMDYNMKHLRHCWHELTQKRKAYVKQFQEEWDASGLEDIEI